MDAVLRLSKNLFLQDVPKAPLCKGRDALRKHAGGMFLAKAGSKLRLRPGPQAGSRKAD